MLLSQLASDVVDYILGFEAENASLSLWLTGDKLLQLQMARSITQVVLQNRYQIALLRVPSYLKELHQLRSLSIFRSYYRVLYPSSTLSILKSLPQGLRKLHLTFAGITPLLFPNEARSDSSNDLSSTWSFKTAFPLLEELRLCDDSDSIQWTPSMYQDLPGTLTELTPIYQSDKDLFIALITELPSQIRELEVLHVPIPTAEFLALLCDKHIHTLYTMESNEPVSLPEHVQLLPRTLTRIACGDLISPFLSQEAVDALPHSLTVLDDLCHSEGSTTPFNLAHLPHLTQLNSRPHKLCFSAASLKNVSGLVRLSATVPDNIPSAAWPPNLEMLNIGTPAIPRFDLLPSGLIGLSLTRIESSFPMDMISLLPRTLIELRAICNDLAAQIDFPPNLQLLELNVSTYDIQWTITEPMEVSTDSDLPRTLNAHDSEQLEAAPYPPKVVSCFPFHCVPRSLHTMSITCAIPASQLVHLPPFLTWLSCIDVFEDAAFYPNGTQHTNWAIDISDIFKGIDLEEESSDDSFDPAPPSTESIASLLPRSLISFTVLGGCAFRDCDWSALPPNLKELRSIYSELPVPASLFKTASFRRIVTLKLHLTGITDEIVRWMPQSLKELEYPPNATSSLTEACLPYWPYNTEIYVEDSANPLPATFEALRTSRLDAIASSSTSLFPDLFPHLNAKANHGT